MKDTTQVPTGLTADITYYRQQQRQALADALIALRSADNYSARLASAMRNAEQYGVQGVEAAALLADEVHHHVDKLHALALDA